MRAREWGIHVEFVKGCNNKDCTSWGTVCPTGKINFMTTETLDKVKVLLNNLGCNVDSLFLYGLGDPLLHPDIVEFTNSLFYKKRLSVDVHTLQRKYSTVKRLEVDVINLTQKLVVKLVPIELFIPEGLKKLKHVFIVDEVTDDLLMQIDDYIDKTIDFDIEQSYRITKRRSGKFYEKYDKPVDFLPQRSGVKICEEERDVTEVNRMLITFDGKFKKCLYSSKEYNNFEDFLNNYSDKSCETCSVPRHDMYEIETKEDNADEI